MYSVLYMDNIFILDLFYIVMLSRCLVLYGLSRVLKLRIIVKYRGVSD